MNRRVAITQPYVPGYRFPLWDRVINSLESDGIQARLFYGGDEEQMAMRNARGDGVSAPWAQQVPTRTMRGPGGKFIYRTLPRDWRGATLLTEMQASNLNAWTAVASRRPYVTFGHGMEYTSNAGGGAAALESILNRRAAHVLTYLPSGRVTVIERTGLPPERVTSFNNATDTAALRSAFDSVTREDEQEFRRQHGIPPEARIAFVLGALNEHKRVDLLTEAANEVLEPGSPWWLVVAGDGPEAERIKALSTRTGRVTFLGQQRPVDYVPAAASAEVIINPGRIGLVAVDALTMRLPVLTTTAAKNAPEAEYLVEGESKFTVSGTPEAFASAWRDFAKTHVESPIAPPSIEAAADIITSVLIEVAGRRSG